MSIILAIGAVMLIALAFFRWREWSQGTQTKQTSSASPRNPSSSRPTDRFLTDLFGITRIERGKWAYRGAVAPFPPVPNIDAVTSLLSKTIPELEASGQLITGLCVVMDEVEPVVIIGVRGKPPFAFRTTMVIRSVDDLSTTAAALAITTDLRKIDVLTEGLIILERK